MKNIAVAIDFGPLTERLLAQAEVLAKGRECKVWLLHVAAPDPDFVGFSPGPGSVREYRAKILREEHRQIQAYAATLKEKGVESEGLLLQGKVIDTLLEEAEDVEAELLIIGASDHGWFFEKLIGNTWPALIRQSKIPLLVIPDNLSDQ